MSDSKEAVGGRDCFRYRISYDGPKGLGVLARISKCLRCSRGPSGEVRMLETAMNERRSGEQTPGQRGAPCIAGALIGLGSGGDRASGRPSLPPAGKPWQGGGIGAFASLPLGLAPVVSRLSAALLDSTVARGREGLRKAEGAKGFRSRNAAQWAPGLPHRPPPRARRGKTLVSAYPDPDGGSRRSVPLEAIARRSRSGAARPPGKPGWAGCGPGRAVVEGRAPHAQENGGIRYRPPSPRCSRSGGRPSWTG